LLAAKQSSPPDRQLQFYFVSQDSAVDGINWRLAEDALGTEDSIHGEKIAVQAGSQLACYWPTHVYQDASGALGGILQDNGWRNFNMTASPGDSSQLAMLPLKAKHFSGILANNFTQTDFRVVYRGDDGFLNVLDVLNGVEKPSGKWCRDGWLERAKVC
jgi:hypothetical protein